MDVFLQNLTSQLTFIHFLCENLYQPPVNKKKNYKRNKCFQPNIRKRFLSSRYSFESHNHSLPDSYPIHTQIRIFHQKPKKIKRNEFCKTNVLTFFYF